MLVLSIVYSKHETLIYYPINYEVIEVYDAMLHQFDVIIITE